MVQRSLTGYHAGFNQWGFWLSQPGVDVTVPGPAANFIMRPDLKYTQIVMSGAVAIGPGQTITVPLPIDFVNHCFVMIKGSSASSTGYIEYPSALGAVGGTGSDPAELKFTTYVWRDQLGFFNNHGSATISGFFMLYNRSIGS
jgi:hypothetical protein